MSGRRSFALCSLVLVACHTEPFTYGTQLGPPGAGTDVLLTYNSAPDYWPSLTEDGTGILYAFVDLTVPTVNGYAHRCVGLMPVAGGTLFWQWCDHRASEVDSLTSIPAFALGTDGRLIYLEASTPASNPFVPPTTMLWLADSAQPQQRHLLQAMPVTVGDSLVNWLADIQWTGPTTFLATAQRMVAAGHDSASPAVDSVFYGEMIVSGTTAASGATLTPISGTAGATSYSLAENGASIVFTRRDSTSLMKVPVTGGAPTAIAVTPRTGVQLLGVSCQMATCVVAVAPVTLWNGPANIYPRIGAGAFELRSVSLNVAQATTVLSRSGVVLSSPLLTTSGDVIAGVGVMFGRLQTFWPSVPNDLHLYKGLVP